MRLYSNCPFYVGVPFRGIRTERYASRQAFTGLIYKIYNALQKEIMKSNRLIFILIFTLSILACDIVAKAQFLYDESGKNSTGMFHLNGDASYTGGTVDPAGNGWIRLTPCATHSVGYVVLDRTFPTTMGVTVEFDFKIYGSTSLADGFAVFLINAKQSAGPFTIGTTGGALGYVDSKPVYMGVGIDEFGNFSHSYYSVGGPGRRSNSIAVVSGSMPSSNKFSYLVGNSYQAGH
jgi:hypothetical protein